MRRDLLEYYLKLRSLNRPFGVRDAQRILGLTSPGKTQRILNKLIKYGLARMLENCNYVINKDLPFELVNYIILSTFIFPRIIVYSIYSTVLATIYILLTRPPIDVILLALLIIAPLWIETIYQFLNLRRFLNV